MSLKNLHVRQVIAPWVLVVHDYVDMDTPLDEQGPEPAKTWWYLQEQTIDTGSKIAWTMSTSIKGAKKWATEEEARNFHEAHMNDPLWVNLL